MRTTVRLPDELLRRAKRKAAAEGRTLTALIEEGLRVVVGERAGKKLTRRRVVLPVSSATGGLMPGIDPVKLATIDEERNDLEYVERMKHFK